MPVLAAYSPSSYPSPLPLPLPPSPSLSSGPPSTSLFFGEGVRKGSGRRIGRDGGGEGGRGWEGKGGEVRGGEWKTQLSLYDLMPVKPTLDSDPAESYTVFHCLINIFRALHQELPQQRCLAPDVKMQVQTLLAVHGSKVHIKDHVAQTTGQNVTLKDLHNLGTKRGARNDMDLESILQPMKTVPGYFYYLSVAITTLTVPPLNF